MSPQREDSMSLISSDGSSTLNVHMLKSSIEVSFLDHISLPGEGRPKARHQVTAARPWVGAKKMLGGEVLPVADGRKTRASVPSLARGGPALPSNIGHVDIYLIFGWGWGHEKVDSIL